MKVVLRIKNRSLPEWLTIFIVLFPFASATLIQLVGLPYAVSYSVDLAWMLLFVLGVLPTCRKKKLRVSSAGLWIILFAVYTLLAYLILWQSPLYYLWGLRNNFRYYVAFFAVAAYMRAEDAGNCFRIFDGLFFLNFVVTLIQYYFLDYSGDYLGGIFGVEQGCNGTTIIFFCIVITKSIIWYFEKKESFLQCGSKCICALFVAALAELKFFYLAFVIILILSLLFTEFTWRKLLLMLTAFVGVSVGTALLAQLFSGDTDWFTLQWMYKLVASDRGYTSADDLNRLTAIPMINELWLKNWGQRLFGLGLGNCDTSGFAFLDTPFFQANGHMHYTWLSYAFWYLECGAIGLAFYWGFFALLYFKIRRIEKSAEGDLVSCCRVARIMAALCVVLSIYNSSLRTEAGYMAYFVLAVPFSQYRQFRYGRKN